MLFTNHYNNVLFTRWLVNGGVAQSSIICDSLYVLLEILQINYLLPFSDTTVRLVTVGLISVGLARSSQTIGALGGYFYEFTPGSVCT